MFTDMHHHILYGLDDGAGSEEQMRKMLAAAAADGTKYLAATPHISLETCPFPMEAYLRRLQKAQQWCRENDLELELFSGAEILYSDGIVNVVKRGEIPTLGDGNFILVEFFAEVTEDELENALRRFGNSGFSIVIAHVERYTCMYNLRFAEDLRRMYPIRYQVNASTVADGGHGLREKIWLKKMMARELVDLIASDAHNTERRGTKMTQAYAWLVKNYGEETAFRLCCENPAKILGIAMKIEKPTN